MLLLPPHSHPDSDETSSSNKPFARPFTTAKSSIKYHRQDRAQTPTEERRYGYAPYLFMWAISTPDNCPQWSMDLTLAAQT